MPNSKFILLCEDDKIALDFLNIYKAQYPSIKICYFPAHDSLPFSTEKSSEQILLDRSKSLININKNEVIIITCNNLLKLIEINKGVDHYFKIKTNQQLELNEIIKKLVEFGHNNNPNVYNKLEFSLRGDILDIYNYQTNPYRISFFDNTIESIKQFNPQSQLTNKKEIDEITIVNPFIESTKTNHKSTNILELLEGYDIKTLNRGDLILYERIKFFKSIYKQSGIIDPYENFYLDEEFFKKINFENIQISTPKIYLDTKNVSLDSLTDIKSKIFIHEGSNESSFKKEYFEKIKIEPNYANNITFVDTLISKNLSSNGYIHINAYTKPSKNAFTENVVSFNELSLGDAIVHQKHGIGRFLSIDSIEISHRIREFVRLIYRNNDKLLLPIENLNLISRYGFDDSGVILDKLGSSDFSIRKNSVKKKIKFLANKLLKNAARRETLSIKSFDYSESNLEKFNKQFGFIETEDQLNSIDVSLSDLRSNKPANRLICGNVGFGKTEVALRIACATYLSGFQFIIVVPTTMLALQHSRTFSDRFSIFNERVATLSRFTSQKEKNEILEKLRTGDIQILIATHSLFKKETCSYLCT